MSGTPDLGAPPKRVLVEVDQVRRLVAGQFSQWAGLAVEPVANGGWDNWTFHLGSDMVVRLPSAAEYAQAVEKEHRWLPVLAPQLPVPIPVPLARGGPGEHYPYPWSIYRWINGEAATADRIADPIGFAIELADFLDALWRIDAAGGPQPGVHNWFRGGPLKTYDPDTRAALRELKAYVDVAAAEDIWAEALGSRWDGVDRWFHGDMAEGNLLLRNGRLGAVIDFGTCGVGDPSCDLAIAWTLLGAEGRLAFRDRLAVDDQTWVRGRGWALWKTLAACANTYERPETADEFETAKRILDEISDQPRQ